MAVNPKYYKDFLVMESPKDQAKASYGAMLLPHNFPARTHFKFSGQLVYDLAIIYHEFAHTMIFIPPDKKEHKQNLEDERIAVLEFENPVRIRHGYEPRYSYVAFDGSETINIITGKKVRGIMYVRKDNPTEFVSASSKDALK